MFFDLSPLELLVLGTLAVLLFGPDRLPAAARTAAQIVQHIRVLQAQAAHSLDPRALLDEEVVEELRAARQSIGEALEAEPERGRQDGGALRRANQHTYASEDVS